MRCLSFVLASAALLALTPGCAQLPTLDVCGNGLKDPGEDCDGQTGLPANVHCAAPSEQNACRYTCSVNNSSKICPSGYFCSAVDGVCRTPNGTFTQGTSVAFNADHTAVADFDGDGIADVFASQGAAGAIEANVYFFGAGGAVAGQTSVPPVSFGAAGPLTGKAAADLVGFLSSPGSAAGMLVVKGDASRSLVPASFSSFPFADNVGFLPLYSPFEGMLALSGSKIVGFNINYGPPFVVRELSPAPSLAWGRSGYLGDASQGGLRLAFANAHDIDVYEFDPSVHGKKLMTVTLASPGATIKNFWFTYFDNDAYQDLAIVTDCGGGPGCFGGRVFVAYGTASGAKLASSPGGVGSASPVAADSMFADGAFGGSSIGDILAIQNLTGGPTGEVIGQYGISSNVQGTWGAIVNYDTPATEAVTADFNRDGQFDVMLALNGVSELEFLLNAGQGQFNTTLISLSGSAQHLAVGDFDGDLFPDVAFAEVIDSSTADVGFVFGGLGAQPAGPLEDGPFEPISQIVPNPYILNPGAMSSRTDLLAVTGTGSGAHLALFPGSANRQVYSPWFFVPKGATSPVPPTSAAIGAFSGGSSELATLIYDGTGGLCLLQTTNGTLAQPAGPANLPKDVDPNSAALVTIAGAAGAPDQVAVVAPANSGSTKGVLALARVQGSAFEFPSGGTVEFEPPPLVYDAGFQALPGGVGFGPVMVLGASVPRLPACAADLDGDGATDLAFIGQERSARSLLIAWQSSGDLAAPAAAGVKVTPDWLACVRTASGTEIAVLEGGEVRLVQCAKGRSCAVGPVVATVGTGSVYVNGLGEPPTLIAGDVTGDGLDDLVLTGFNQSIQVYAAQPTIP